MENKCHHLFFFVIANGLDADPFEWDSNKERYRKNSSDYRNKNADLDEIEQKAIETTRLISKSKKLPTVDDFMEVFKNKSDGSSVIDFFNLRIKEMKATGKVGNAFIYYCAKLALQKHTGKDIEFEDVDYKFLKNFETQLRIGGAKDGGISNYMRTIRALYNEAIRRRLVEQSYYPFSNQFNKNGYSIANLKSEYNPRGLQEEVFKKFINSPAKKDCELAYDMAMFSFFTRGMNWADICRLEKSNFDGDRLSYKRKKTGKWIHNIKLNEITKLIYEKYKTNDSTYLFPILWSIHKTEQQKMDRIVKKRKWVNKQVREIAKVGGIENWEKITWYTLRHTFAGIIYTKRKSKSEVSELLGHATEQATKHYLDSLGFHVLDKAESVLMELY